MTQKEKNYLDPESNNSSTNKLIKSSVFPTYYEEELKSIQRALALLRQDLLKIVHEELIRTLTKGEGFYKYDLL